MILLGLDGAAAVPTKRASNVNERTMVNSPNVLKIKSYSHCCSDDAVQSPGLYRSDEGILEQPILSLPSLLSCSERQGRRQIFKEISL